MIEVVGAATSRPAAGIQVLVVPPSLSGTIQLWRFGRQVTTDADGLARLEGLEPGFHQIRGDRGGMKGAKIRAGEETRVQVVLPRGFRIVGNAFDEKRNPVPGAAIWLYEDESGDHPVHVTTAGPDGKFSIDEVSTDTWFPCVGARMDGYAPSTVFQVHAPPGGVQSLDLVLDSGAARLHGRVVDKVGNPVVGAFVFVSLPQKTGVITNNRRRRSMPSPMRKGASRSPSSRAASAPWRSPTMATASSRPGRKALAPAVFANGRFASWRQTIDTATNDDTSLEIRLGEGGFIVGTVTLRAAPWSPQRMWWKRPWVRGAAGR